jgi:CRISPR-associated protein Csd1
VGDASTVCWSAKRHNLESDFATIWGTTPTAIKDDPDKYTDAVKAVFKSVGRGSLAEGGDLPFYVLGLAPNASRIAIRFWLAGTVSEFSTRVKEHFDYLEIVRGQNELEYLPLFFLLVNTAVQGKADNIPPNLGGETMRTILAGQPYPYTLFAAAIRRCKATQDINYARAAIIKAYLNKFHHKEVLKVALDKENTDPAYRLGRLFASLEKIQEEANPGINSTIKDRYYGAASSNPVSVFSTLLKLSNHHLAKLENRGRKTNFEKLLNEIMADIPPDLPTSLSLQAQGKFAVGYYHQRQDFFIKRDTTQPGETV